METIKLTENKLREMISESVAEVLSELNEGKTFKHERPEDNDKKIRKVNSYNRKKVNVKDDENISESKQVRLSEEQLTQLVAESTMRILKESDIDEGWFGDKFNQGKAAASTLFNKNTNSGLGQRFSNMKKNWNSQGELNNMNNLIAQLTQLLDSRKITPETTVGQLVGGRYNNGKFGTMSGMQANRKAQISNRGGQSY